MNRCCARRGLRLRGWVAALVALAMPAAALAHGTFHARLGDATAKIEASPDDASLYVARSSIYRSHGDWALALADLDRAAALEPDRVDVDYHRGRIQLAAGEPARADEALSRFLKREPEHPAARIGRGRARAALGRNLDAARDYTLAIERESAPTPDHYVERARALMASGDEHLPEALEGLDQGLERLGPLVTLLSLCVDIEVALGRIDAALLRLDGIAEQTPRQESWLVRRGEILEAAGRPAEATRAYEQALSEVAKLPAHRRHVPATAALEQRARSAVERLATRN